MQRKTAHHLNARTRHLIGQAPPPPAAQSSRSKRTGSGRCRARIPANGVIVNPQAPEAGRVGLDVYARGEDLAAGLFYRSLDKLNKQRE